MITTGDHTTPAESNPAMLDPRHGDTAPLRPARISKKPVPACIVSGENLDPSRMLKFVIGPDNLLYPDFSENLPGAAYWCNLYRDTLVTALDRNLFGEKSGHAIIIPPDMMERIETGLRAQALSMISMARKAGMLVTGAEKTEAALRSGKAGTYLTSAAREADTRQKLTFHAQNCRIIDLFTSDELTGASGGNGVVHAAMMRGGIADRFFEHVKRLNLFQPKPVKEDQE